MKIKNLKIGIIKNPVLRVFTKEYMDEIRYRELLEKNKDIFKLKCEDDFDLEERIKLLKLIDFNNNMEINN